LTVWSGFVSLRVLAGLWLILYFHSVRWDLRGTASHGCPSCPVWYSLSRLSVLSNAFQIDGQEWLLYTPGISNWVSCVGQPCVRIGNELGGCPSRTDLLCVVIRDVELLFLDSGIHCNKYCGCPGPVFVMAGQAGSLRRGPHNICATFYPISVLCAFTTVKCWDPNI